MSPIQPVRRRQAQRPITTLTQRIIANRNFHTPKIRKRPLGPALNLPALMTGLVVPGRTGGFITGGGERDGLVRMALTSDGMDEDGIIDSPGVSSCDASNHFPSFLCTFCWIPQFAPSKPKTVGATSRISCETCWRAILDLSICWVCGEMVLRGDHLISLGWCFWHLACFSCLLCKTPLGSERLEELVEEEAFGLFEGVKRGKRDLLDEGVPIQRRKVRLGAIELERVPVCEECERKDVSDWPRRHSLGQLTAALDDRGLSCSRVAMFNEIIPEGPRLKEDNKQAKTSKEHLQPRRHRTDLSKESMKVHVSGSNNNSSTNLGRVSRIDGNERLALSQKTRRHPCLPASEDSTARLLPQTDGAEQIYVSIFDPINGPSFRASPTKPLPKWMNLLPSNIEKERERARAASVLQKSLSKIPFGESSEASLRSSCCHKELIEKPCCDLSNGDVYESSNERRDYAEKECGLILNFKRNINGISGCLDGVTAPLSQPGCEQLGFADAFDPPDDSISPAIAPPPYFPRRKRSSEASARDRPKPRPKTPYPFVDGKSNTGTGACIIHNEPQSFPPASYLPKSGNSLNWKEKNTTFLVPNTQRGAGSVNAEYVQRYQPRMATGSGKIDRYVPKDAEPVLNRFKRRMTVDAVVEKEEEEEEEGKEGREGQEKEDGEGCGSLTKKRRIERVERSLSSKRTAERESGKRVELKKELEKVFSGLGK